MTHSLTHRLLLLAAAATLFLATAAVATGKEYVPFTTDFPKGPAPVEPYRPFATDFGIAWRPPGGTVTISAKPPAPTAVPATVGRDWADVALGSGLGIAFVAALVAAAVAVRRLARRGHGPLEAPVAATGD